MKTACTLIFFVPLVICGADPLTWFEREAPRTPSVIAHGNGVWWAAFNDGRYTSANGVNWIKRSENQSTLKPQFVRGQFYFPESTVYASSNGWSNFRAVGAPFEGDSIHAFTFGNEQFYAIAQDEIATSTDGVDWIRTALPGLSGTLKYMAAGSGAVVLATSSTDIYSSFDAQNWSSVYLGISLSDLEATPLGFLALEYYTLPGGGFATRLYHSYEGQDWRLTHEAPGLADRIFVGPDNAIVWGLDILATAGHDGSNWTDITRPSKKVIRDIAYGDGRFLGILWPNGFISSAPFNIPHIRSISRSGNLIALQVEATGPYLVERTQRIGSTWDVVPNTVSQADGVEFQELSTSLAFYRIKMAP